MTYFLPCISVFHVCPSSFAYWLLHKKDKSISIWRIRFSAIFDKKILDTYLYASWGKSAQKDLFPLFGRVSGGGGNKNLEKNAPAIMAWYCFLDLHDVKDIYISGQFQVRLYNQLRM